MTQDDQERERRPMERAGWVLAIVGAMIKVACVVFILRLIEG